MKTAWLIIIIISSICIGLLTGKKIYSFEPIRMVFSTGPGFGINRCLTDEQIREMSKSKTIDFTVYPGGRVEVNDE